VDGADPDSRRVQTAGRDDETHAVEERALPRWELGSVRVSMEDGEESDQRGRRGERRTRFEHHGRA
jgi:hypothetical protein